jgi:high-affinity iron transporter
VRALRTAAAAAVRGARGAAAHARGALALALALVAGAALAAVPASAASEAPWRAAEALRSGLFEAQSALIVDGPRQAVAAVTRARSHYDGALASELRAADASADRDVRSALAAAARAARAGDDTRLAAARGAARAAVFRGAFAATLAAVDRGDARAARDWLLLREFRTATRFTRPGADATVAVAQLQRRRLTRAAAHGAVAKDLLDAYQARLRELLDDAARGEERDLPVRRAEAAAQAEGYFAILAPRYRQDRGVGAAARAQDAFAHLRASALAGGSAFATARAAATGALDGFTAAPFTPEEAARRAQQLLRFLALVPVEYGRGVRGRRVTLDFEVQEAVAFRTGAQGAFADLRDQLAKRDRARADAAARGLARLGVVVDAATKRRDGVVPADDVKALTERTEDALRAAMPDRWEAPTDESDYDLIAITLDRMEAAAGAGQFRQAEQARLEAYAFFEFGPERRLKAFDPGLALDVEGLVWFGSHGQPGLAKLIDRRAPRREIHEARLTLDGKLEDAAATLGDSASRATVVTNSAIIVFREGLEAVLILAAITASFVGVRRRLRRPVLLGALLGLLASGVTWVLAQTLLRSLERYGERLEAIVGLIAIGVLLLITNWFFHRVYWSEWIGKFHRRRRQLEAAGFVSAQVVGLAVLGLTSVYREGFETVLFLQSLELSAGTATVLEGAGLGLAMTLAVAVLTFALQRKLPYKRMLIVTGVLIGFVLVVMVGQTARTMQGTGWIPITAIDVDPPYWLGLWFGVYPTWETIGAQVGAMVFVIGSYFLAQEVRVRRPRRRARSAALASGPGEGPAWRSDAGVVVDANGDERPDREREGDGAEHGAGTREAAQARAR